MGIGTSNIKAKKWDSPLARGAGVVGGSVPTARAAAAAAAAEGVIGGWEEVDKSSRASSAGNQGFGVGRKVAMGISVKRGARIVRVGTVRETVPTPPRWQLAEEWRLALARTLHRPDKLTQGDVEMTSALASCNKRNLKTPVKTRTLHLSEPYWRGVRVW